MLNRLVFDWIDDLPVFNYRMHCLCDCPGSLRCLARAVLLKQYVTKITAVCETPWTNCCSLLACYQILPSRCYILSCWLHNESEVRSLINDIDVESYYLNRKCVFVIKCSRNTMIKLLKVLQNRINIPDGKGYHLGPVEFYWRSLETATLNSARTCLVRYIKTVDGEVQEREVKRKLYNTGFFLNKKE